MNRRKGYDRGIVGGSPESCGYKWDKDRRGWYRPFGKDDMFTPADQVPKWKEYIPKSNRRKKSS